jgi:hypothetical protein
MQSGKIEKFGRTFKLVNLGLDHEEVMSFMEQVVNERDGLLKKQEHINTLTRLYEKTVADADDLAKQIKEEAKAKAQNVAKVIIEDARKNADAAVAERIKEATERSREQIEVIKENAKKQVTALLNKELDEFRLKIGDCTKKIIDMMDEETENLVHRAGDIVKDFEANMSEMDILASGVEPQVEIDDNGAKTENNSSEQVEQNQGINQTGNMDNVEIEILPPRDNEAIAAIISYFNNLPDIVTLQVPETKEKSKFTITLKKQVELLEIVRSIPQVHHAEESDDKKQRKILVTLSTKAKLEATQNMMTATLNKIFAEGK